MKEWIKQNISHLSLLLAIAVYVLFNWQTDGRSDRVILVMSLWGVFYAAMAHLTGLDDELGK